MGPRISWGAVALVNEAWRAVQREIWSAERGASICAPAGHDSPIRGAAFLARERRATRVRGFKAIDERTAYIGIDFPQFPFRSVAACYPHGGNGDHRAQA
eukprot:6399698-Pyramimonas_sp.AAC.1